MPVLALVCVGTRSGGIIPWGAIMLSMAMGVSSDGVRLELFLGSVHVFLSKEGWGRERRGEQCLFDWFRDLGLGKIFLSSLHYCIR